MSPYSAVLESLAPFGHHKLFAKYLLVIIFTPFLSVLFSVTFGRASIGSVVTLPKNELMGRFSNPLSFGKRLFIFYNKSSGKLVKDMI